MSFGKANPSTQDAMKETMEDIPAGSVEIDLRFLLFRQIDRINIVLVKQPELLLQSIYGLEALLYPYLDEQYNKERKEAGDYYNTIRYNNRVKNRLNDKQIQNFLLEKEQESAMMIYKSLVSLAERMDFYPKRKATVFADEYEEGD